MKGFGEQKQSKKKSDKNTKPSIEQIINQAFRFHAQGNISAAAKNYQYLIKNGYKDHRVFSNYGIILKGLGKLKEAELYQRKAIQLKPDSPEAHSNLGNILKGLGKLKEAELYQRKAIQLKPDFPEAHSNLGNILKELGNLKEAELYQRKAIQLKPNYSEAYYNLGIIVSNLGNLKEAELYQRKAIEINPNYSKAHSNLGIILKDLGNLKEAELCQRKAIQLKPDFPEAHSNLGVILKELGNLKEAELYQRKAIQLKPDFLEAHSNLGVILKDLGNLKEAELYQRKAIELNPDFSEAHSNLGVILKDLGKLKEAELLQRKAIELNPNFSEAYYNLGIILSDLGKLKEAKKAYESSYEIDSKQIHIISNIIYILSKLCMWDEIEKYSPYLNKIGIEGKAVAPLSLMYIEDNPLNHLKRAIKFSQENRSKELPEINCPKKNKIKIGYFSSDFKDHSITHLLIRTLELHDKSKFEIYAYSLSEIKDAYTIRVKEAVSIFKDVSNLSEIEIVKVVRNDQIDIAIDLNGYTKSSRSSIFFHKVAPIQINYLGYPGSMGSKSYDYILADKVLIPEENKKFYIEKVLYHPNCHLPFDDKKFISEKKFQREELGLPLKGFVFTCFNGIYKINKKEFIIWMKLLKKVEGSVLWLIKPHQEAINNIHLELRKNQLSEERVIFAERVGIDDHFSRHSCADLFLDTFNYNAATMAQIALSCGLPIITLLGKSCSARIAGSILNSCDLNELITYNTTEYEELAYKLATNKEKFDQIKEKIRNKRNCTFFDSSKYTKDLENIYINLTK